MLYVVALHIYEIDFLLLHCVLSVCLGEEFGHNFKLVHHRLFEQNIVLNIKNKYATQGIVNACNTVV